VAKNSKKPKKSQKYRVYSLSSTKLKKMMDKQVKEFRSLDKWPTVLSASKMHPFLLEPTITNIHFAELQWERQGRNALFINLDDIRSIERGKCNVKFMPDNFLPFKSFMLCLPAGYEACGIRPTGVLVTSFDSAEESLQNMESACKEIDPGGEPISYDEIIKHKKGVSISYRALNEEDYTNITLFDRDLEAVINCGSFAEYLELRTNAKNYQVNGITSSKKFNDGASCTEGLTVNEKQMQYTIFKLIMSLSMYVKAKPESLVDGFPLKGGFSLSEPFSEPVRSKTVNASSKHKNSPEEHHRGWFIRQLVAECYYRGEYKDLEPGSRMVFVDETTVNLKVASHNVQGEAAA
jgi:hypothetical protein